MEETLQESEEFLDSIDVLDTSFFEDDKKIKKGL